MLICFLFNSFQVETEVWVETEVREEMEVLAPMAALAPMAELALMVALVPMGHKEAEEVHLVLPHMAAAPRVLTCPAALLLQPQERAQHIPQDLAMLLKVLQKHN